VLNSAFCAGLNVAVSVALMFILQPWIEKPVKNWLIFTKTGETGLVSLVLGKPVGAIFGQNKI
jgi:hypothetical protein